MNSLVDFVKLKRERLFFGGVSDFCPGFVSKTFLTYQELLGKEEVKERLAIEMGKNLSKEVL